MIVGHRIESYLTGVRVNHGPWEITEHTVTTALNATKGWHQVSHRRRTRTVKERTSIAEWRAADRRVFKWRAGRPAMRTNAYGIKPLQVRP